MLSTSTNADGEIQEGPGGFSLAFTSSKGDGRSGGNGGLAAYPAGTPLGQYGAPLTGSPSSRPMVRLPERTLASLGARSLAQSGSSLANESGNALGSGGGDGRGGVGRNGRGIVGLSLDGI